MVLEIHDLQNLSVCKESRLRPKLGMHEVVWVLTPFVHCVFLVRVVGAAFFLCSGNINLDSVELTFSQRRKACSCGRC